MNKKIVYLLVILIAIASLVAMYFIGWNYGVTEPTFQIKAPVQYYDYVGKDTTACFGNGRYQIMHGHEYTLSDTENQKEVLSHVSSYKETENHLTAFIYGQDSYPYGQYFYLILHEETNQIESYTSPDQIHDHFKEIFETLIHQDIQGNKID